MINLTAKYWYFSSSLAACRILICNLQIERNPPAASELLKYQYAVSYTHLTLPTIYSV